MTDPPDAKQRYTLRYNDRGVVVPPQTTDMPIGFFTAYFSLVIPFAAFIATPHLQIFPMVLQYAPTFRVFQAAGLLSESKIAEIEFLILIHLIMRTAIFPVFKKRYLSQFFVDAPPPIELKHAWPRQIMWALKFGTAAIAISLTWGIFAETLHSLTPKFIFCTLGALGVGLAFTTEGVLDLGLYLAFCRKYWNYGDSALNR